MHHMFARLAGYHTCFIHVQNSVRKKFVFFRMNCYVTFARLANNFCSVFLLIAVAQAMDVVSASFLHRLCQFFQSIAWSH